MKKLLSIITIGLLLTSCIRKREDIAEKQSNGLYYKFIDYIGPDSCKLYECVYKEQSQRHAGSIFLTICKDRNVSTSYSAGKQHITNFTVLDTVIRMVPTMVPETSMVVKMH